MENGPGPGRDGPRPAATGDIPHSPAFAPVLQPTPDTGVKALTVAALARPAA
ncbi:hypothetical protein GCM10010129_00810 [Streptomyces fumigatiscleroticus]|nr:hypothetical protein GCM10010129_00810 [Streptomyces fumigatiscleroticus]